MEHYVETPWCFGKYDGASNKCWGCECAPCCKWQKEDREEGNTMYMEIKITKPAETQEKSAPTMEELAARKEMLLSEIHRIKKMVEFETSEDLCDWDIDWMKDMQENCAKARIEIMELSKQIEDSLVDRYNLLLGQEMEIRYKWVEVFMSGDKKCEENLLADLAGTRGEIEKIKEDLRGIRDRKFTQK